MKKVFLLITCCFLVTCLFLLYCFFAGYYNLQKNSNNIDKIVIGHGYKTLDIDQYGKEIIIDETKIVTVINEAESINDFIDNFSFYWETGITVKHRFWRYIELHLSNGKCEHITFEGRLVRINGKEYTLSMNTQKLLKDFYKKRL